MLDSGDPIDTVYLDFHKAFDSVPHQRLHTKIVAYGFNGNVLDRIQAFLTYRKQCVVVNNLAVLIKGAFSGPHCLASSSLTYPI